MELRDLLALQIIPAKDFAMASGNEEPITIKQEFYIRDLFSKLQAEWERKTGRSADTIDDAYSALMASLSD